jgi:hypothetical protein
MLGNSRAWYPLLAVSLALSGFGAACGSSGSPATFVDQNDAGGDGTVGCTDPCTCGGAGFCASDGGFDFDGAIRDGSGGDAAQAFDIQPSALQTITVAAGTQTPTVLYTATSVSTGSPVKVGWNTDRGDLGSIAAGPSSTGTFTPSGLVGGTATITAGYTGLTVKRQVMVKLTSSQNGATAGEGGQVATTPPQLTGGGGVGGVGGEGLGGAVDPGTIGVLGTPAADASLKLLYPYDKTVWPRGMLAPLLQWDWATGDADAVLLQLTTTSGSFTWSGTFARPAILTQTGGKFIRHPIPQDVWDMATNSAGGADQLTVSLTVARGGKAFGPIKETWTVATGRLPGIIYYNSYGTQLAQNLGGAVGGNHSFGGAVLSIHVGDTGPKLAAGATGTEAQCRVCHSVASGGARLVVQHGDAYGTSSAYDLSTTGANVEHVMTNGATFPAVAPDGSMALSPSGQLYPLPNAAAALPVSGLAAVTTNLGTPAFSPDGKQVVFNPMVGPTAHATQTLGVMSFNAATGAFSNFITVVDDNGQPATTRPGWPAFLPDGKSIVFHHQSAAGGDGNGDGAMFTRKGAKSQIHWTSASAINVNTLNQLNGKDAAGAVYLPKLATPISMSCGADGSQVGNINPDHGDDVNLNYEPTVNPLGSGGYAWVVFTSRRMYGSVANIPPFCSDPRGVDLIQNITPKKLWVAAIDLSAAPGTDGSHPAFYLPAQELLAGNSRAFWVLDPCRTDGTACQTGDQCCNGYCEANGDGGALVCSNTIPNASCAKLGDKCAVAADCCDATASCIGGFCTQIVTK